MYLRRIVLLFFGLVALSMASCKKESLFDAEAISDTTQIGVPKSRITDPTSIADTSLIVVVGSSTAYGFGASCTDSSWVGRLTNKMIRDRKKIKVINLGVPGYTTYEVMPNGFKPMTKRPKPDTVKNVTMAIKLKPELIIFNLPSNDIASNYRDEEILDNYRVMIRHIASARINYIITGSQPRNFQTRAQRNRLNIINDKLKNEYADHLDDYFFKLSTPTYAIQKYYSAGDGIHLNNKGHRIVYQSVMNFPIFKDVAGYN